MEEKNWGIHLPVLWLLCPWVLTFITKIITELSFVGVISLFHPWVTCLPGCKRKTGAFICLFCDNFVSFEFHHQNYYWIKFFWSNLSVASLHPVNNTFMKVYRLKEEALRLQYCCRYLSLLPSFYETQSIHVECEQNVFLLLILCYSFKFRAKKKKTHASSICKRFLFPESNDPPKVTTPKGC